MLSINVVFQHGHIYNAQTGERILVEEGVDKYVLVLEKAEDMTVGRFKEPFNELRSSQEIRKSVEMDINVTHIKKVASEGSFLFFFISWKDEEKGRKKEGWFRIKLLEDLYLYMSDEWKHYSLEDGGHLVDCACVVDASCVGTHWQERDDKRVQFPFFEKIPAKSVTSAYKLTHIHFFGNEGSPSKNAFRVLHEKPIKSKEYSLQKVRQFTDDDQVRRKH